MIPKSPKQLRREPSKKEKEARRSAKRATRSVQPVTVYSGTPFEHPADTVTAPASQFAKPHQAAPRPQGPRLKLKASVRRELFAGGHPRLAFPRKSPKGRRTYKCPVKAGDVVELSSCVSIVVTGTSESKTEYEVHYELQDARAASFSIGTRKGIEGEERMGGPRFEGEADCREGLPDSIHRALALESNADVLARLRERRNDIKRQHDQMQEEGLPSTVLWGLRRSVSQLDQRIEGLEREFGGAEAQAA